MDKYFRKLRICAGASAGGHMQELLRMVEYFHWFPCHTIFYVTTLQTNAFHSCEQGQVYIIGECNRHHLLLALRALWRCIMIVKKERPDVVITTGSMPMALLCFVSKCFGSKVIWIDSIASIRHLSMSGRMVYLVADLILSQWPEVAARYSKVEYVGELI